MIYSLICSTLRLFSLATVLADAIVSCKTGVKMSAAAWQSRATTQVRAAEPGRDPAPLRAVVTGALEMEGTHGVGALRTQGMLLGGCNGRLWHGGDTTPW